MSRIALRTPGKGILTIVHLVTGERRFVKRYPFVIGTSEGCDWRLVTGWGPGATGSASITNERSGLMMTPIPAANATASSPHDLLFNGDSPTQSIILSKGIPVTLKVGPGLFALCLTHDPEQWVSGINLDAWIVFNNQTREEIGTVSLAEAGPLIASSGQPLNQCALLAQGLGGVPAFWAWSVREVISESPDTSKVTETPRQTEEPPVVPPPEMEQEVISTTQGDYDCPICWQPFFGRGILHIASHHDLRGDEILGPTEMRRFTPTDFDDDGNPLDDYGLSCPEMACPHCHHRLPQGYLELPQNIFSIVGAPSSGKSYYLAILIKELQRKLFKQFSVSFGDQDPFYNIDLNATSERLFSASTPKQGAIRKTDLVGGQYRRVYRNGQEVDLPQPYIFYGARTDAEGGEQCLVFYDNAGEHFLPQNSTSEDFHILHVAKASALFFLFDPVSNLEFKRRLRGVQSEQLELENQQDNQGVILAQMQAKITQALHMPLTSKLEVPLAVMVGKSDLWSGLLEVVEPMREPFANGCVDQAALERNSSLIRRFMAELCPEVVQNAERLSSNVRYFPVSSFGHKPETFTEVVDIKGEKKELEFIAPDPMKIKPRMLEVPTIWALSQIAPELVPIA